MFIHAHGIQRPADFLTKEFQDNVMHRRVPTSWCNVWGAEMALIEAALLDSDVTLMMVISADSIPIKPLQAIYDDITKHPHTRMCVDNDWSHPRAETWWLMHR